MRNPDPSKDLIECPDCAELIPVSANVCRYCQAGLSDLYFRSCPCCSEMVSRDANSCRFCHVSLSVETIVPDSAAGEGLALVRTRPAMYIGSTGPRGLHHLVWELIDNSLDEALAGYCKNIFVTFNSDDSVTVLDDGRGIPTYVVQQTGKTILETAFTSLLGGGKFVQGVYSHGLHGVGLGVVNALCDRLEVEVYRDNVISRQVYGQGKPKARMQILGATERRGTSITIWPDRDIFYDLDANKRLAKISFDWDALAPRLRELAFLNKGLAITLADKRFDAGQERTELFCFAKGIRNYLEYQNLKRNTLHRPPVYFERERDNVAVECALQWTDASEKSIHTFANNIGTADGGTHLTGFYKGLIRVFNDYAQKIGWLGEHDRDFIREEDLTKGLTAIVSVKLTDPLFTGPTKEHLANTEVEEFTELMVYKAMLDWFKLNQSTSEELVTRAMNAHWARG